ncbi:glutathione S-transferase family protein [Pseudoalteromonas sp. T1lg24]|uniref:glutathione S-transferase family protein n=1 Tax=Pseudoalteromonas sp. T1lg24 TaxID=2077099 RepID=UPI000CF6C162|nr:glutathione S-transferase family protein [Pseudoalteromonas sp. T1lg24]
MITLYEFPPAFGLTNASPFALKLEAYCKLAKIEYQVKYRIDSEKMPKKKFPVALINNELVADSNIILAQLDQTAQLDASLSNEQHALGYLIKELIEEKLYWCLVYSRWVDDAFWPTTKTELFSEMPGVLKLFVPNLVRKNLIKSIYVQGLGRHSTTQIYDFAIEAVTHLANLLGEKPYFVSDYMTQYDCAAYATLTNLLNGKLETPIKAAIEQKPNLVAYINRCYESCGV